MGVRRNKKGQTGNKRDTWGVTLKTEIDMLTCFRRSERGHRGRRIKQKGKT